MALSVNRVTLLGRLGRDAETRQTAGQPVTSFSVATERSWKLSDGHWKTETDWHNVVMWGKESLVEFLGKGKRVFVEGRLQTRSYEDKNGNKRYVTEVVAETVIALDKEEAPAGRQSAPAASNQVTPDDVPW